MVHKKWSVSFPGRTEKPGREISVERTFSWAAREWYVPSVYLCPEGLIVDFCIRIPADTERAFLDRWASAAEETDELDESIREQIARENPMAVGFTPDVWADGRKLRYQGGSGSSWCCLEEWLEENSIRAEEWMEHYALDRSCCWSFFRQRFDWMGPPLEQLHSLKLELEQDLLEFPAETFTVEQPGQTVTLTSPVDGADYRLQVLELATEDLSGDGAEHGWQEPDQAVLLRYRLTPPLDREQFYLKDADPADLCRRMSGAEQDALAIIGGADGPVAFCIAEEETEQEGRTAVSALRFEQQNPIRWQPVFCGRTAEKQKLDLL